MIGADNRRPDNRQCTAKNLAATGGSKQPFSTFKELFATFLLFFSIKGTLHPAKSPRHSISGDRNSPGSMVEEKENTSLDKLNEQTISENSCTNVGEKAGAGFNEGTQVISKFKDRPIPHLPPQPMKRTKVTPKTRSEIWFHFTRLGSDRNRAACNYCGVEYAACSKNNGTSNLWSHFKERCKKNPYKLLVGQVTLEKDVMVDQITLEKCGRKKGLMAGQTTLDKFMVKKEPLV